MLGRVGDAADHDVVDALEDHAEHRLGVAARVGRVGRGRDVLGEQLHERRERDAQLERVVLRQPAVLAHEHARVAELTRVARSSANSSVTHACSAATGFVAHADALGERPGADLAVVLEQREQQLVLAGEAAVERLQREAGAGRDLGDGERGAGRLARELAGGGDAALHALDVAGRGRRRGCGRAPGPASRPAQSGWPSGRMPFSRHYRRLAAR